MNKINNLSLVSIVVPIYNTESYLKQCLDSLVNQTYKNIELILVDDGSTDNSGLICDQYQKNFEFVKVIHKPNGGSSSARQTGVQAASGEWVTFVDADDWLDLKAIEKLFMAQNEYHVDLVICSYIREYAGKNLPVHIFNQNTLFRAQEYQDKIYRRLYGPLDQELNHPEKLDSLGSTCMKLYPRQLLLKADYIDNRTVGSAEDVLLNMSVLHKLNSTFYLAQSLYHYRKTNICSLSTRYRADLAEKWQNLYSIMANYITKFKLPLQFNTALNNRIACGVIGLGLNNISSDKNIFKISRKLKEILSWDNYRIAFQDLRIDYMPFKWKIFFLLAKYKQTLLLIFMLKTIKKLRKIIAN